MGDDHGSDVMVTTRQQRLGFGFIVEGEPLGGLLHRDLIVELTRPDEIELAFDRLINGVGVGQ